MQQEMPNTPISATVKKKRRLSPFWFLPIVALLITGWLLWKNYQESGTTITINFHTADGIVPGRTPIRYQGVEIGTVQDIVLTDNYRVIKIKASIKSSMKDALRANTKFWLVTPQASLAGVSGLDALVGGNYIGMMPGDGATTDNFTASDSQPKNIVNNGGLIIQLHANDLGSLNTGSQVYYQKVPVGRVYDYSFAPQGKGVLIDVLIERRYTQLVKKNSRFWNVSGLQAKLGASGVNVNLTSVPALINGAIAFDSPQDSESAQNQARYELYPNLAESKRGVNFTLKLPSADNLTAGSTALMYQGLQVGTLTHISLTDQHHITGELTVDPSVVGLMRTGTRIEMRQPSLQGGNLSVGSLLAGTVLQLIPGEGEAATEFTVLPASQSLLQVPNSLTLELTAPESYGIDAGQPLILNGVPIGKVAQRTLTDRGVVFQVSVEPQYRHFIHADSQFIADSQIRIRMGLDGLKLVGAPPQQWIQGGIRVNTGENGQPSAHYPLYADDDAAKDKTQGDKPSVTLKLKASSLPDIQAGSVVLYRRYQVGEIVDITPNADNFIVSVHIAPEYRKLITDSSVFWAEGGARVQFNSNGITVQATPLNRALKGAISFDSLSGVTKHQGKYRELFASRNAANAVGSQIVFHTFDGSKLAAGMPIKYLGINVGQVESLSLSHNLHQVEAKAVLYPEYDQHFARSGSQFSVVSPEISSNGVNHLESLLQPYVNVDPGTGSVRRSFELQEDTITDSRYLDGLNVYVDAPDAGTLTVGTPVLYRGVEVGTVTGTSLGDLADRVQIAMRISTRYQHLVRNNSVFWLASGYSLDFGLTGGVVKTGTFQQFIRGGIQFATPPTVPLAPEAESNKHFLLRDEAPDGWQKWGTAIPRQE
ncbi:PqiB family protein [Rosenbergiella nectarea]|uniref:PqiB family protein n=1 Tax=Rosenbergiella nectarea TaxID=988801 RepID=UPI001F4F0EE3|nr:MlaD family protein [Rosenbergiella nectarea]